MVATNTTPLIRVDTLSDADSKSSVDAASIGIENRAKLESPSALDPATRPAS